MTTRAILAVAALAFGLAACAGAFDGRCHRTFDPGYRAGDANAAKVSGALGDRWRDYRVGHGLVLRLAIEMTKVPGPAELRTLAKLRAEDVLPVSVDSKYPATGAVSVTVVPDDKAATTWSLTFPSDGLPYLVTIPWIARVTDVNGLSAPGAVQRSARIAPMLRMLLEDARNERLEQPYQHVMGTMRVDGACPTEALRAAIAGLGVIVPAERSDCLTILTFDAPVAVVPDLAELPGILEVSGGEHLDVL